MNRCTFLTKSTTQEEATLKVQWFLDNNPNKNYTYDLQGTEYLGDVYEMYLDYLDHRKYYDQLENIKADIICSFTSDNNVTAVVLCEILTTLIKQQFDAGVTITYNIDCSDYSYPEDPAGWWVTWVSFE